MKRIAILGSTGSIGQSTLRVIEDWPEQLTVVGLAAGGNLPVLLEQVRRFKPQVVSVGEPEAAAILRREVDGSGIRVLSGAEGLTEVAAGSGAGMVVSALVGAVGLRPTLAALNAGIDVGLANKETLVAAGEVMTAAATRSGAALLPIDSEHAALHQILAGRPRAQVHRLVLTASGGPFRCASSEQLASVTLEQALKHPTWAMGAKITVDSATLANKALEVIEARWLFDIEAARIGVLVHPQSTVHALVEFVDGTYLAQLGINDMRSPIQYALFHPDRRPTRLAALDLARLARLDFEEPDLVRFPCLALGFEAARAGGNRPAVFNAANEVANLSFRERKISFSTIAVAIEYALSSVPQGGAGDLESVLAADAAARDAARKFLEEHPC